MEIAMEDHRIRALEAEVERLRKCETAALALHEDADKAWEKLQAEVRELTGLLKQAGAECQEWKDEAARQTALVESIENLDPKVVDDARAALAGGRHEHMGV